MNNLKFDYIETYSFQRGAEHEENLKVIRPEYDELKVRKEKQNNLTPAEEKVAFPNCILFHGSLNISLTTKDNFIRQVKRQPFSAR
jgi:hypothetical protein